MTIENYLKNQEYIIYYMVSLEREVESSELHNKDFLQVHSKFVEYGWELTTNTMRTLIYSYPVSAYDEFHIGVATNGVEVCTPVPKGNFAYRVKLNTHAEAVTHILRQLEDFETKRTNINS
jgi:hypothetical protein